MPRPIFEMLYHVGNRSHHRTHHSLFYLARLIILCNRFERMLVSEQVNWENGLRYSPHTQIWTLVHWTEICRMDSPYSINKKWNRSCIIWAQNVCSCLVTISKNINYFIIFVCQKQIYNVALCAIQCLCCSRRTSFPATRLYTVCITHRGKVTFYAINNITYLVAEKHDKVS